MISELTGYRKYITKQLRHHVCATENNVFIMSQRMCELLFCHHPEKLWELCDPQYSYIGWEMLIESRLYLI